jgi:hypothetical protein
MSLKVKGEGSCTLVQTDIKQLGQAFKVPELTECHGFHHVHCLMMILIGSTESWSLLRKGKAFPRRR